MSLLLAIETSQRVGGVALRAGGGEVHVEMLRQGDGRHSDDLMAAIDRLFGRMKLTPSDLKGGTVGVSVGPGGFTGLRIAVTTAKMLAETLGVRIVAAPSAMVVAEGTADVSMMRRIVVALACKGETFWSTRLERGADNEWRVNATSPPGLADAKSIDLRDIDALVGDQHLPDAVREVCKRAGVRIIEPVFDAAACLRVAQRMSGRGEFVDPLMLLPLYPREPEAVRLWKAKR